MDDDDGSGVNLSALNPTILNYYKKFGKKRDLEQYFSLSTAQGDARDPTGIFWKQIKSHSDSSDSGGKRSESSQEVCRISIQCSIPEPSSSQDENTKTKESVSPPIIIEELSDNMSRQHSGSMEDESEKSDDNQSQKSLDVLLDTSMNKPFSPTSSVTSQRKLEWDSLADVGYANESDRKTSASSLSTLERLALKQQYSNNDTKNEMGAPTAQSTPIDENSNTKLKKGVGKKTKFTKKNTDYVEVNVPHVSNTSQGINVNLTKHISFSVATNGAINIEDYKNDNKTSPERVSVETKVTPQSRLDKEIQTSLYKTKGSQSENHSLHQNHRIPVLIRLNSLRRRNRRRRVKLVRKKSKTKKRAHSLKEMTPPQERSGEQLSEAESFEYMPGHIYNQNQMKAQHNKPTNTENKSSLESSGITTDSSKISKLSFTKDLEKSIELLKATCKQHCEDKDLKKKLIKEIIKRLLTIQYRDDESTTDFLSGLSSNRKKAHIREQNNTTSSNSDSNKTSNQMKAARPRNSILRIDSFNANALASTSQSAPNLPAAITSDKINSNLVRTLTSSNTDSDVSSREKTSSDAFAKTSSEELYLKYLEALKREQAYKKHLKDKELFLKQKLTSAESVVKASVKTNLKVNNRLKDLMKDLTRNNYDDGSGDASKLEGSPNSNASFDAPAPVRSQHSHSVFTLSSGTSEGQNKKSNLKKKLQNDIKELSKDEHYCRCPHHSTGLKVGVTDSSVQVNLKDIELEKVKKQTSPSESCKCKKESPRNLARIIPDNMTGEIKYVCLCDEPSISRDMRDNFLVYKCSRLANKGVQLGDLLPRTQVDITKSKNNFYPNDNNTQYEPVSSKQIFYYNEDKNKEITDSSSSENMHLKKSSKSSQTNLLLKMLRRKSSGATVNSLQLNPNENNIVMQIPENRRKIAIKEATRCIQTEISINPQISDPSLSDINIVNDVDCVKFIGEQIKEVSRRSSETEMGRCKKDNVAENILKNSNDMSSEDSSNNLIEEPENVVMQNVGTLKQGTLEDEVLNSGKTSENFTIPIQGTNMTLMVSIGANDANSLNTKMPEVHKSVITERNNVADRCTSLTEECSKGIQYDSKAFTSEKNDLRQETHPDNNTVTDEISDLGWKKSCYTNTCIEVGKSDYNTIPKRSPVGQRRFLRANTDTGTLKIQTEEIMKTDKTTQQGVPLGMPSTERKLSGEKSEIEIISFAKTSTDQCCGSPNRNNKEAKETNKNTFQDNSEGKEIQYMDAPKPTCSTLCGNVDKPKMAERDQAQKSAQYIPETSSREFDSNSSGTKKSVEVSCEGKSESRKSSSSSDRQNGSDPILDRIRSITRRYSKDDMEKNKRKKCFKEIMTVLNYLLDTDDSTDWEKVKPSDSCTTEAKSEPCCNKPETVSEYCQTKEVVDRGIQLSSKKSKKRIFSTESSELPTSTDLPATSSDSATCKILNKIKKECEKFHQKRCKSHSAVKKCEVSSTTSANCDQCRRTHHCSCRVKCKGHRSKAKPDKADKKSVAYNLIIQTSESMVSEEVCDGTRRPLKNIVVKVPSRRNCNVPFKEMEAKIERRLPDCSPRCNIKTQTSRSLPNESEISSLDDQMRRSQICTVREYLELNRPDFVEKSSQRQNCLKVIRETRANKRATHRDLLSMHVEQLPLTNLDMNKLRHLARQIGVDTNNRKHGPKFIGEKEMKKHSEKIYKSLAEVVEKKEKLKKENIKKTNLLMADIFKKNLQKRTLRGYVNTSNYNTVIKI
ncbi:uncharacterized protein LOC114250367 isoform X1 [Bombyx mandarina]|uniref:Uncharacterized protein LOC114250367 isoform X1 n=1 Tax=Bombyx mandarina TaxID=7092 RepID=A0A6J2KCJ7_BOMMA|nr:uncharacterized protein LOC114250367 isoform X1 [Bombyx mandarina]